MERSQLGCTNWGDGFLEACPSTLGVWGQLAPAAASEEQKPRPHLCYLPPLKSVLYVREIRAVAGKVVKGM